ncbi:MAG: hypothetical protein E5W01_03215 [Mesorhizobium sp.]|nr:MAG: hypothetical protein E5W01_03215 [Mesorhizobium sp.]TIX06713.1 MAG: hypothetical protein E5V57_04670 [Mesorhizobium sp.]
MLEAHDGEKVVMIAAGHVARYYRRWAEGTLANIDAGLVELMPSLARFVPPAKGRGGEDRRGSGELALVEGSRKTRP